MENIAADEMVIEYIRRSNGETSRGRHEREEVRGSGHREQLLVPS